MTKIILRTSIVKLPGRKREPDSDHAVMILELVQGEGGYFAGDAAFFAPIVTLDDEAERGRMDARARRLGRDGISG